MNGALVIVNPTAGGGRTGRLAPELVKLLPDSWRAEVVFTDRPGHATQLARDAAAAHVARVIAVGGDGTILECAAGILGSETQLGTVPTGRGCDFNRSAGLPRDPASAARALGASVPRAVDVGMAGEQPFLNVAGAGLDATIARAARAGGGGGTIPYVVGLLKVLPRFSAVPVRIELDDQVLEQSVTLVAVANGAYYAGGMMISPGARIDDGLFDVCVIGDVGRLGTLRVLPTIYSGRHLRNPAIQMYRSRHVRVEADRPVLVHRDGEEGGELPAHFSVRPGALQLLTPNG